MPLVLDVRLKELVKVIACGLQVGGGLDSSPADEKDDVYLVKSTNRGLWIKRARYVSYISIVFTLVGGVVGVVIAALAGR